MTDEQWEEIRPFAEAYAEAQSAFAAAQAMNTPTGMRKRIEADARFQRIRMELDVAASNLDTARRRVLGV